MITWVQKYLINPVIVLVGVTALSFLLSHISVVDPAEAYARHNLLHPTPEQIEEIRLEMGLHLPLYQQYFYWIGNVLKGDLGSSFLTGNAVAYDIIEKLPTTLLLVGLALFWIVIITVPVSVFAAVRKDSFFDHLVKGVTIVGASLPNFWLGFLLLLVFAVTLPVFNVVDYGNIGSLVLPSLALAIPVASVSIRLFRAAILSNLNKDYVIYLKARGIGSRRIIWVHVLRNALPPMVTLFGQYFGHMIAGSAVVESIFSLKGIGMHMVNAIVGRDLPTINGCIVVTALLFIFGRMIADGINRLLNPRMMDRGEVLL